MNRFSDDAAGKNWRVMALCLVGCCFYQFVCMNPAVDLYDEGVILFGAMRVAGGDIPHRDFYANYGPGQFYILAGIFKLLSPSVLIERVWDSVARSLSVAMVFLLVARCTGSAIAAACTAAVCTVWLAAFQTYGYPVFPALAAALAGLACLLSVFNGGRSAWMLAAAGACTGLALLFRYDIGIFTFLTLAPVLGLCVACRSRRVGDVVRVMIFYSAGFALVGLPLIVAYASFGVVPDLLFDLITFPSGHYLTTRALPFPNFGAIARNTAAGVVYLPLILSAAAIPAIVAARRGDPHSADVVGGGSATGRWWMMIALLLLTLTYFGKGTVRVKPEQMAMAIITSLSLTGIAATAVLRHAGVAYRSMAIGLVPAFLFSIIPLVGSARQAQQNVLAMSAGDLWAAPGTLGHASCRVPPGLERLACFSVDQEHLDAIRFLQERTRPGDYIYVGIDRHDKIFMNDITLYFLAGLRSATKWHHFDPGLQTSEPIQRQIIKELEHNHPRFAVLESQWDAIHEPNASALSSGVVLLDDYIRDRFKVVATFNTVSVLEDKHAVAATR